LVVLGMGVVFIAKIDVLWNSLGSRGGFFENERKYMKFVSI